MTMPLGSINSSNFNQNLVLANITNFSSSLTTPFSNKSHTNNLNSL